jgi:gentisate 1,2-dioxygenase
MQGNGADTGVGGELYEMREGDLVLTPNWAWHDHEHKGSEPMVWLDVLDISIVRTFHATFFEGSDEPRQRVNAVPDRSYREFGSGIMRPQRVRRDGRASPLLAYTKDKAEEALRLASGLDADPYDDILLEYQNPLTGGSIFPTIGTALQLLRPGVETKAHRHTGSAVYYVVRGEGTTVMGEERFDWGPGDFMALPPWVAHRHANRSSSQKAVLFQVNDLPAIKALGFYREEEA